MKHLKFIILSSVIVFSLALPANAHPGRTDSNGGHYDHSTGEYHYHHGYPEHDHYDMDGDGDLDCPYNFVDRTGANSGSDDSSQGLNIATSPTEAKRPTTQSEITIQKEGEHDMPMWGYWLIGGLALALAIVLFLLKSQAKAYCDLEQEYKKIKNTPHPYTSWFSELFKSEVRRRRKESVEQLRAKYAKESTPMNPNIRIHPRDPYPFSLYEDFDNSKQPYLLPWGIVIEKDGLPSLGCTSESFPYGRYTVFISPSGKCFHDRSHCGQATSMKPVNIMTVIGYKRPCSVCANDRNRAPNARPNWYRNFANVSRELAIDWSDGPQEES